MKGFAFSIFVAVFLVVGAAAFAFGPVPPMNSTSLSYKQTPQGGTAMLPNNADQASQWLQSWVGKTADALTKQVGMADDVQAAGNGGKIYQYRQVEPRLSRYGSLDSREYDFVTDSQGTITGVKETPL